MLKIYGIDSEDFEQSSLQEVIDYFGDREFVQFDSETLSYSPHNGEMLCFQLGDYDNQWVIGKDKVGEFKEFLETKTLIGHNIKFDLQFLYHYKIYPIKVWDTFLAETILTCGLKTVRRNLAVVAKNRVGVDLDKSVRDAIWKEGLTKRVIEYSGDDVKYLEKIKESQEKDLKKLDLEDALQQDNEFVLALAYIEYCGFKIDKEAWKKKIEKDKKTLEERKEKIDNWVIDNQLDRFINKQMDLFSSTINVLINWASSKQVIKLFKFLNIPVTTKKKGKEVESIESKNIDKYKDKFPIVKPYLEYKEAEKVCSTYGDNFLRQINKTTGRLHTTFKQILDTGRLSSGGKNKSTGEEYLNFQNIPSDKETRSCFIAAEGNSLIISDYSGQEQIVLANKSLDQGLLDFYDKGLGDMHAFVASKMYPEIKDLTLKEIKKDHPDKRQNAKTAGFAINYGGVGATIAANNNLTIEEGNEIYEAYFEAFPGLKDYFNKMKQEGLRNGFIVINTLSRRKSFIEGYNNYKELQKEINRNFWERWRVVKQQQILTGYHSEYDSMKQKISNYFKMKGDIERKSLNFPIQGTAAEISKRATAKFFDWIKENNYLNIVLIPNMVHDEIIAESPTKMAKEVAEALQKCMEDAGEYFYTRVKLKATPVISDIWTH